MQLAVTGKYFPEKELTGFNSTVFRSFQIIQRKCTRTFKEVGDVELGGGGFDLERDPSSADVRPSLDDVPGDGGPAVRPRWIPRQMA